MLFSILHNLSVKHFYSFMVLEKRQFAILKFFISSLGNTSSFVLNLLINYFSQLLGTELTTKAIFSVVQRKDIYFFTPEFTKHHVTKSCCLPTCDTKQ